MADATTQLATTNSMLGSQLVGKSILNPTTQQPQNGFQERENEKTKVEANKRENEISSLSQTNSKIPQSINLLPDKINQHHNNSTSQTTTTNSNQSGQRNSTNQDNTNINNNNDNDISLNVSESKHLENLLCHKQEAQSQQVSHEAFETGNISKSSTNKTCAKSNNISMKQSQSKDLDLLAKEAQEFKIKTRKLQLEIEEKNEIINVLKDELEATKDLSDKLQRENLQLIKDSKRVKFLQDENDFLQDKVGSVDKLELEIKRLKEKLTEVDFLKLRIRELEEDKTRAINESALFEEKWRQSELKLNRVSELEVELSKWKSFSHEIEAEKNTIQSKLLESIEQEAKLNTVNKQVEDEVKRLRSLIKKFEEQRDEEQASNSLILNIKPNDESLSSISQQNNYCDTDPSGIGLIPADTSIKFELEKELEKELNEENRNLKQQLNDQENQINKLLETNREINVELESNKKLISELRQDFACEKSLTSKLTNQLTNFTKQIKNLNGFEVSHQNNDIDCSSNHRKSMEADGNANINNITHLNEELIEKKSSLSSVTSVELKQRNARQQQQLQQLKSKEDTLQSNEEKTNEHQANNSYAKKSDNETRQLHASCGSKLSASPSSSSATSESQHSQLVDDDVRTSKQSKTKVVNGMKSLVVDSNRSIKSPSNLEGERIGVKHSPPNANIVMTKSTTVAVNSTSSAISEISDKGKDESCCGKVVTSQLSSSSLSEVVSKTDNNPTDKLGDDDLVNKKLGSNDRSEVVRKTTYSPENLNEELLTKREHALYVGNNGNRSNYSTHITTSASPNSNARSQSPSSLIANNFGHDSGFQSINHDHTSSSNAEVQASKSSLSGDSRANSSVIKKQQPVSIPTQINQLDQPVAIATKNISSASSQDDGRKSSTPTVSGNQATTISMSPANNASTLELNHVALDRTISNRSQRQQHQISTATTSAKTQASSANGRNSSDRLKTSSDIASPSLGDGLNDVDSNNEEEEEEEEGDELEENNDEEDGTSFDDSTYRSFKLLKDRAPTPVRSRNGLNNLNSATTTKSSNFVRNSLPSRSVNFGHSKPLAFLDRIRASVTATTTTNTSTSFNGQTRNIVLSKQEQLQQANLQQAQQQGQESRYELNCMLDHQHSDRCFVLHNSGRVQQSQVVASDQHNHHHNIGSLQSSRQLNALIDPVSDEQLMMNMLQHQGHQRFLQHLRNQRQLPSVQHVNPELDGAELTEQQMAHLASLHRQHYYHHLQQMRQLHQLHHQHYLHLHHHRMHHKYQQQQQPQKQQPVVQQSSDGASIPMAACGGNLVQNLKHDESLFNQQPIQKQTPVTMGLQQCEPTYLGGSQFYAPSAHFDQVYSNMTTNNNIKHVGEHNHRTRLVSNSSSGSNQPESSLRSSPSRQQQSTRSSPQRLAHQLNNSYTLPQIDEVNGLPIVESLNTSSGFQTGVGQHPECKAQAIPLEAKVRSNIPSNVSSSSSSPTSSASSNLSPSSSASSSSSLNSLSNTPLNRSALRHTTTELGRRHFSIERDVNGALPMKATLSRVGSCRSNRSTDDAALRQLQSDSVQMRTPVKTQQPSMRTSKILNISHQSNTQATSSLHSQHQQQQLKQCLLTSPSNQATQAYAPNGSRVSFNSKEQLVADGSKLSVNLAKINLNDNNLAFTSIQMPTRTNFSSPSRDKVLDSSPTSNASSTSGNQQPTQIISSNSSTIGKIQVPSFKEQRLKQAKTSNSATKTTTSSTTATKGTNGNKSSVWFEYGCV